ncbi:anaphase-promoting complex, subunit 10-domain-containing protein [Thelonectria olida]|uniref:Anaphase-promoting complex, subunit 10-domain-containing protein n=1 Tax=Thelonectria olida TaxID=1576542 RepID=A0A9P9AUN0_9HYPO|nr:anaphase-promoting complex, subunit 10-domain-containing protein [Thelonectria olida]
MDNIARGSRRARHVAAHAANANAHPTPNPAASPADALSPHGLLAVPAAPGRRGAPSAALVTPDAPPPPPHRTPDQPVEQLRRAPPPNPFRLYRTWLAWPFRRPALFNMVSFDEDDHMQDITFPPLSSAITIPPLKRVPLQELPISRFGNLTRTRERTLRPCPSLDKENLRAVRRALEHRRITLDRQFRSVTQIYQQYRLRRNRLIHLTQNLDDLIAANSRLAAQPADHPRLSMPLVDSDDSGSEPDLSVLGMARPGPVAAPVRPVEEQPMDYDDEDDEVLSQEQYEAEEDTSIDEEDEADQLIDPATIGLKEISNLAKFTVSSHKPGNGVEELRSDDLKLFWQSDGPQPHRLTVYFVKRVGIRDIRFFVDYNEDESYTPTKVVFKSGTSENNLIEFASMALDSPVGWQQVPLTGAGGDPDGNTLISYVLQMQILENHQNGKDTHLRGIKIYAFDADSAQAPGRDGNPVDEVMDLVDEAVVARNAGRAPGQRNSSVRRLTSIARHEHGDTGLPIPDFMRDPEIR